EARYPFGRALRDRELDIGNAEIDLAEALLVRAVEAELVAPRAGRLDVIIVFLEPELGALELLLHRLQPLHKSAAVGGDDADMAAHNQRLSARQVELALADIDPHVVGAGEQVR